MGQCAPYMWLDVLVVFNTRSTGACITILSEYNSMSMENKLLQEIDRIVWDDGDAEMILAAIQRLMYQWGANMDHKTEEMFGDDDAHITKRKFS